MDDTKIKLEVFEEVLWRAYLQVISEESVSWVSLHKVMAKVGMSLPLFQERLEQLWKNQFTNSSTNKYRFGLEVDATPTELYRLRNKTITIEGVGRFIINMTRIEEKKIES